MKQDMLWHDHIEDALMDVLRSKYKKGWAQKAAADMFPTESPIDKGKWLEKALDPERAEKLALCDLLWILRVGRDTGCHSALYHITDHCSYARPTTIEPEDKRAELQREVIRIGSLLAPLLQKLEKMD